MNSKNRLQKELKLYGKSLPEIRYDCFGNAYGVGLYIQCSGRSNIMLAESLLLRHQFRSHNGPYGSDGTGDTPNLQVQYACTLLPC
jgi:hypothetical protein